MAEKDMGIYSSVENALEAINKNHPKITKYETVWWGDKQTASGNMSNRGYVIGFKNVLMKSQWRLDYDPIKKVHINWTQEVPGSDTLKECYQITSYVFGVDEKVWQYYIAWTKTRFQEIPQNIKSRLDAGGITSWNGHVWQRVFTDK